MSRPELDLVFCCDCTGSMGSYIESAQENIKKISQDIMATEQRDVRYALVCYRDHPPQESTYVTKVFDFTSSIETMKKNVDTMSANGGGDGPEAVTAGMHAVLGLSFRKNSVKICVIIADAPPHGLEEDGDGFPDGDPEGRDPIKIAKQMKERGIVLYCVACEPALSGYKYARDFFQGICEITRGRFINLGNAHLLPKVIVGGAEEEFAMEKLAAEVEQERIKIQAANPSLSTEEIIDRVAEKMTAEKRKVHVVEVSMQISSPNYDCVADAENLKSAKSKLTSRPPAKAEPSPKPSSEPERPAKPRSTPSGLVPSAGPSLSSPSRPSGVPSARPARALIRGSSLASLSESVEVPPRSSYYSRLFSPSASSSLALSMLRHSGDEESSGSFDYMEQKASVRKTAVSREHIAKVYERLMARKSAD